MTDKIRAVHPLRVAEFFEDHNLVIDRPSELSIRALLENATVLGELANPDIFQLSAIWSGMVQEPKDLERILELISSANSTLFAPKAYTIPGPRLGTAYLAAEGNVPIGSGLSELQFFSFIETTLTAIVGFFSQVELVLPHLVTWGPAPTPAKNTKLTTLFPSTPPGAPDMNHDPLSDGTGL